MLGRSDSSLSLQLTRAISLVGIVSAVLIAVFAIWSASKIDDEATIRERTLVRRSLDDRLEDMQREQESLTAWDDAVTHARAKDWPWISENIGIYLHTMFKHDEVFILDPEDKPVYAMADGKDADPVPFQSEAHDVLLLVKALRQKMAASEQLGGLWMADYIEVGHQPCLVSVKPILPFTTAVSQAKGTEFIHVSVIRISDKLLADLGSRQLISHLHYGQTLVSSSSVGTLELPSRGPALGFALWNRDRPGTNLLETTAPVLAAAFLAFLAFIGVLSSRLRRTADDLIDSRAQSQRLARHDTLTGLPNRAHFNEQLREAVEDCQQGKAVMALHYVDLDRFKNINDTLGHPAGDELIRQVATRLSGITPAGSLVARLGGDEFAIIHTKLVNGTDAQALGAEIVKTLREPFDLAGDQALIGASVGIAMCNPAQSGPDELMREADIALYEAKGNGKDRYYLYAPELGAMVKNKRRIERDLREALKAGGTGLRLVYQPLFGTDGTSMQGAEALVRWRHPIEGELSPATFVTVAEERGLIVELGDWVLREACRTLRDTHLPWVAVNVSAVQLREPSFPLKVMTLLGEYNLTPGRLQIEITEGVLLDPSEQTAQSIMHLREAGIRVALDDFGTGYCSLQYLHRYTVDKIKIDKSFVQDVSSSSTSRALVRSMISLARAFDMEVTAEGIETEAQWAELTELGCGQLQGYLFAKPMPASALPSCNTSTHGAARTHPEHVTKAVSG